MAKRTRKVMASSFPIPGRYEEPSVGRIHPDPTIRELLKFKGKPGFGYAMHHVTQMQKFGATVPPRTVGLLINHYLEAEMRKEIRVREQLDLIEHTDESVVYFIRFSDRVKIGTTTNLKSRLEAIPHDEVIAVISGSYATETAIHNRFAHLRVQGEWFRATDELLDWVKRRTEQGVLDNRKDT